MKNFLKKTRQFVVAHKVWTTVIVIILALIIWQVVKSATSTDGEVRYVTSTVTKGTIISSISASGQVEASSQIDLKADASAKIVSVNVKGGDLVKKGQTLFVLDARDARKTVRDAEINLESAKLSLQATLNNTSGTKESLEIAVANAYQDLLNSSLEAVSDLPDSNQEAPTISGNYTLGKEGDIMVETYSSGSNGDGISFRTSGMIPGYASIVSNISAQPLGNSGLFIKFATTNEKELGKKWIIHLPNKKGSTYISNYNKYQSALRDLEKANTDSSTSVIDIQSSKLNVRQKENALEDAKNTLSDYYITAPFDGMIASVVAKVGDTASTTLGSIITDQKIALLSMNEVDVSKIKLGEKASITFDAIEDLSMTGQVVEIDAVGTVSQGVVSYSVKVAFDTSDERVKPGMSVSASIITNSKTDVLMIPASAVKVQGTTNYVQMFTTPLSTVDMTTAGITSPTAPEQVTVEIGISDDTNTEIISGLAEGDQVVSRTITTKTKATTQAPSLIGGGNVRTTGGGGFGR